MLTRARPRPAFMNPPGTGDTDEVAGEVLVPLDITQLRA